MKCKRTHGHFTHISKEIGIEVMYWILLAQDAVKWRAAVNM